MTPDDKHQAVFGGFDSICSLMGLVLYLAIMHGAGTALAAAVAGALGNGLSMGIGEYLSDGQAELRAALVMGVATLVFGIAPAAPLLVGSGTAPIVGCLAVALGLCGVIARLRPEPVLPSIAKTYGGFILCVGGALGLTLLIS